MAFIKPIVSKASTALVSKPSVRHALIRMPISREAIIRASMSPHPAYDVAAVSTYIAYFMAQYWTGEERWDVELFAVVMAMFWNFTHDHDATIFIFLWVIGGASEFVGRSFLAGGNASEFQKFHVGVRMGGYMSFLLLVLDLLGVLSGF